MGDVFHLHFSALLHFSHKYQSLHPPSLHGLVGGMALLGFLGKGSGIAA